MKGTKLALTGAALAAACCGSAWADDANEAALEREVIELRKQVADLARRVGDGTNRSDDELEQRIAELEKVTKKDQDGLFPYWKTGTKLDSVDGAFKISVFGRLQNDWVFWDSQERVTDRLGETAGGTLFRRARIGLGGTVYKNVIYKYEMDFAGGSAANWADAFLEIKDPTCGAADFLSGFRVGHFDEPMGFDRLTSSKYGTFMERGLPETFTPQRNTGMMVFGPIPGLAEGRMNWYLGYFRDANGNGDDLPSNTGDFPASPSGSAGGRATQEGTDNDNRGEHNLTMRVAGRPWVGEDSSQWIHVGGSLSLRNPSDEAVRYSTRPEIRLAPAFVDTGTISGADNVTLTGLEFGGNFGPIHTAAEYIHADVDGMTRTNVGTLFVPTRTEDHSFDAFSIQAGYFLTGETREYEAAGARWDRVKVKKNFGTDGMGAFEVALRYSHIDLSDGDDLRGSFDVPSGKFEPGGELSDWTLGLNWYLNPNTRIMLNLIRANRQGLPPIHAVGMRFAIDF